MMMADPLDELSRRGVSVWLDDLSRQRLTTGSLADLVARGHVAGVTTNPTIFAKAITGSDAYSEQIGELWDARHLRPRGAARADHPRRARRLRRAAARLRRHRRRGRAGIDRGGPMTLHHPSHCA
jgi:transaldolase